MSTILAATVNVPPALVMKVDDQTVPMTIQSVAIDVSILGRLARTTMQMTFYNPHDQIVEGELLFPLPDGAALEGYALDIDGELVEASLVEKQKARIVFETEVRKNVDPGLVEYHAGNQFRTRIWPIPSRGTRTIKVSYVSTLINQDGNAVYDLPLKFDPPNRDVSAGQPPRFAAWGALFNESPSADRHSVNEPFRMSVRVTKGPAVPVFESAEAFGFRDHGQEWVCDLDSTTGVPERVRVSLPLAQEDTVTVERHEDDSHYFRIDVHVDEDKPTSGVEPARVAIVWDGSLSRATVDKSREVELLRSLLTQWDSVTLDLFVIRDEIDECGTFEIFAGECGAFIDALVQIPYDGGTRIAALEVNAKYDACLMFTDGISTLSDELPVLGDVPIYVVSSGSTINGPLIRHISDRTGGEWLDLERIHPDDAAARIGLEPLVLLGVEADPAEVAEIVTSGGRVTVDGSFGVSGSLLVDQAEITLRIGRGRKETERRKVKLSKNDVGTSGLVGRLWAQGKVDELVIHGDRYASDILDLGRRFHLVTPNTSLLVLETLEQHLEHKIPPATSQKKMRKQYDDRVLKQVDDKNRQKAKQLNRVHKLWQNLIAWWEKEYDRNPPKVDAREDNGPQSGDALLLSNEAIGDRSTFTSRSIGAVEYDEEILAEINEMPQHADSMFVAHDLRMGASWSREVMDDLEDQIETGATAETSIKAFESGMPYLKPLREAGNDGAYAAYLEQRTDYGRSPSFYFDCADHFFRLGKRHFALRVLSNVIELDLDSPQLLRIVSYKLEAEGELSLAAEQLERVRSMRPEEPQSHRDLALVLERLGNYRRAAELLWHVVETKWDERFPEIETIALMELNWVLERAGNEGLTNLANELNIESRFLKLLDLDLRIVLGWDADLTDIDLWVIEPNNEKCFYSHNLTQAGGRMSKDFTQGYGPEIYTIRNGIDGKYTIQATYFSSGQQTLTGPATLLATVFTNYGRRNEQRQNLSLRVTEIKDIVDIGEVNLEKPRKAAE